MKAWLSSLPVVLAALLGLGATGGCSSSSSGAPAGPVDSGVLSESTATCEATVGQGPMKGKVAGNSCEYLGLRYAKAPVGTLRFAPPQAAEGWQGTLDATKFGDACMQANQLGTLANGTVQSSEDCLFLNVYTPRTASTKPLPVMVFIHGGGFTIGAGSQYDAQALSEAGPAVVVTLNYRLGALGYLALKELDDQRPGTPSGSDGIRDQQLALFWVKNNIATFHGDASSITLFGESAGSFSTCIHIVSPGSQGLAQRFIMESGSCIGTGTLIGNQADRYQLSQQLADSLCPASDGGAGAASAIDCLRTAKASDVMTWVPSGPPAPGSPASLIGNLLGAPFFPIVEGPGGVLPAMPAQLIASGAFNKTANIIAGTNAHEFALFVSLAGLAPILGVTGGSNVTVSSVAQLDQGIEQIFGSNAGEVEAQYPATDATAQDTLVQMVTDYQFRCPTRELARLTTAHGTPHFYLYSYEYGEARHSDEVPNLFTVAGLSALGGTALDPTLESAMKGYWTRMAAAGDPNGAGAPTWPVYTTATDPHLVLNVPPVAGAHLDQSNCDFWDKYSGFTD
jgi:para-nitrobenzyl esterase